MSTHNLGIYATEFEAISSGTKTHDEMALKRGKMPIFTKDTINLREVRDVCGSAHLTGRWLRMRVKKVCLAREGFVRVDFVIEEGGDHGAATADTDNSEDEAGTGGS